MSNVRASSIAVFSKLSLGASSNSAREKAARQQKMNSQVDYWENKKESFKGKECGSLEAIKDRLEQLQACEDEIAAAKKAYNHEQMFHVLDEAREQGEKIAEEMKKHEPKTAEERQEELAEEALGTDESSGGITESLEELTDEIKEMAEDITELVPEDAEELEELRQEKLETEKEQEIAEKKDEAVLQQDLAARRYRRINLYG